MTNLLYWPIVEPRSNRVVQLSHFDGTSGSFSPYTNSAKSAIHTDETFLDVNLAAGQSFLSNAQVKFGTTSLRLIKSGGGGGGAGVWTATNINFVTGTDFTIGNNPFTIEWWQRLDTLTKEFDNTKVFLDCRNQSGTAQWVPMVATRSTQSPGDIAYFSNGSSRITATGVLTALTWQSIAVCRTVVGASSNMVTRLFVDGNQVGSDFIDNNTYVPMRITLGCAFSSGGSSIGFYDEFRFTNGVGWYGAGGYTPATAAFPNQ